MKKADTKAVVGVFLVLAFTVILGGCQEENASSLTEIEKQSRLIAMENTKLKKQLELQQQVCQQQLQKAEQKHKTQMEKQKQQLEDCRRTVKHLEDMSREGIENYMSNILGPLVDENNKLRKENESLKARIKSLQERIEHLKNQQASSESPEQIPQ